MQRLHSSFCDLDAEVGPAEPPDPRVRPTEQRSSNVRAIDLGDATMEDEARAPRRRPDEVSLDAEVFRHMAEQSNEEARRSLELAVGLVLLVVTLAIGAIVLLAWRPFA